MHLEEVGKDITISEIKDKGSKISLLFDNGEKAKVYRATYIEFNLNPGITLNQEAIKEINSFDEKEEIIEYLKSLIAKRPYNEAELLKKCISKFKNYNNVSKAISELKSYHLIDDQDYIENYMDYFDRNNYGKYFIINFFKNNGLKEELIEKLEFCDENELKKARNYFDSIKNKYVSGNFAKQKKKIYDLMLRRGFSIENILEVLNDLKVNQTAELERLKKDYRKVKMKYFVTNDSGVDANSKIISKLINKGYNLEDINTIIEEDNDFGEAEEILND